VRCPDFVAQEAMVLRNDARRYELGSQNLLGLAGLRAALDLAAEVGLDAIAQDLVRKRTHLVAGLLDQGAEVLQPDLAPKQASGIVSFRPRREDARATFERLNDKGVNASLRVDRSGGRWIRFSPHYYNTVAELGEALRLVAA
jgi:selenocysteine lyase/cysteine desulfurase